jgi:2-methylcitrate dehydratase PrpD
MSHAEALPMQAAVGATETIVRFVIDVRYATLPDDVRHYAKRHFLDSVGVMIAGAQGEIATQAENLIASVRPAGDVPVPGRRRRADLLDAAFLGGTGGHGIELDDGYRHGSAHPGCVVTPAVLALAHARGTDGPAAIEAVVAGYETATALARACHPDLRQRGFHPTPVVGVFAAAMAAGKLRGLSDEQLRNALGIAASAAAGLFAFVNGGGDIKRLHAGHASREGLQAALLAQAGVQGPPNVIECRDGFLQAFAGGRAAQARVTLPPAGPWGMTDCYIKPNPCCRHIQPATEALIAILEQEGIATEAIRRVEVETYRIAAEHAHTGWDDYASAQLSFPYLMALAMRYRCIRLEHFSDTVRSDPVWDELAGKLVISAPAEIDRLYPQQRPARVTVTTERGRFTRQVEEALGSRHVPLDDAGLEAKFRTLVDPVLGATRAADLARRLWALEDCTDLRPLVEELALS